MPLLAPTVLRGLAPALLAGCTFDPDADHRGDDAPGATPLARSPRVAWVFSSGGPRGFVHVGVIKALAELGLEPDVVVGASAGAIVGALCACRVPAAEIERLAFEVSATRIARLAPGASERFSGAGVRGWLESVLGERRLEELPTPLVCVAQRLRDGAVLPFNRGDLGLAVQASSAIEGVLAPVRIRGERYADADQRQPLPVRLTRSLGARRVLAVDASAHEERAPPAAERYRDGDLRKRALTRPDAQAADVLLHPDFGYWVSLSREFRERAIDAGYRATLAQEARLRELHAGA